MEKIELNAEKREIEGRKVKGLRRRGMLPANVSGRDIKSLSVQINLKDFKKVFEKAGETNIVELVVGKEVRPVLIHNIQTDPVKGEMLHVDFLQVDLKKKVTAEVPVELVGISPVEKQGLGTVVRYLDEIEVEALPTEIPDKFEIDISKLGEVGQMIMVKDIKVDENKVKIETDGDLVVIKVEPPKEEKEELPKPVESEDESTESSEGEENKQNESTETTEENK